MDEETDFSDVKFREQYGYIPKQEKSILTKLKQRARCDAICVKNFIICSIPIITWLPKYRCKQHALGDIFAGLTTAVVRIPQGLAYGQLAGLDPINGLYTGFFSPLVYMVFGTSRHISVGVFSIVSLMLGSALDKVEIAPETTMVVGNYLQTTPQTLTTGSVTFGQTDQYHSSMNMIDNPEGTQYTYEQRLIIIGSLTALIGLFLILLGVCRLGIIAVFLSDPLVSAFTTGAAIYVVTAQMKYITGIPLQRRSGAFGLIKTYVELFSKLHDIKWASVIISLICLVILIPIKYVNRNYKKKLRNIPIPVELFIVVLGTVISAVADLEENYGVGVVGNVPSGMPSPRLPDFSLWPNLIADALSIAIVIFVVSVSMGKLFAKKHGYKIDPNQELFAIGLCQITNSVFRGHAGSGALARSTVQESSGGNSQLAGLVSSTILLFVLLLIGPLFKTLPVACLACIILVNLHGLLIQFQILPELWKLDFFDFLAWLLTFISVILLGIDLGLGVGIIFSLCFGTLRNNMTMTKELGRLPNTDLYRDISRFQDAVPIPGIKIMQLSRSPTYANKSYLQDLATEMVEKLKGENMPNVDDIHFTCETDEMTSTMTCENRSETRTKCIVFDCSNWNIIDTVGMTTFKQLIQDLSVVEVQVLLAAVPDAIYQKLIVAGILNSDPPIVKSYPDISYALKALQSRNSPRVMGLNGNNVEEVAQLNDQTVQL